MENLYRDAVADLQSGGAIDRRHATLADASIKAVLAVDDLPDQRVVSHETVSCVSSQHVAPLQSPHCQWQ